MISLDGFFEGPKRELDWHNVDKEFHEFADRQLSLGGYSPVWTSHVPDDGELLADRD